MERLRNTEKTLNMMLGLYVEYTYQTLFEKAYKDKLEAIKVFLYLHGTKWLKINKTMEKTILRTGFRPIPKVWYQFLKYSMMPTSHAENVNKGCLIFLHCVTIFQPINISKIK